MVWHFNETLLPAYQGFVGLSATGELFLKGFFCLFVFEAGVVITGEKEGKWSMLFHFRFLVYTVG